MTRRREHPTERRLKVKWSTREWVPPIKFGPGSRNVERSALEWLPLDPVKARKRRPATLRQVTVLWVRNGARNGSRSTWR